MNTEQKSNFPNPWLEIGQTLVASPAVEVPKAVQELAQETAKKVRKPRKSK